MKFLNNKIKPILTTYVKISLLPSCYITSRARDIPRYMGRIDKTDV